MTKTVLLTLGRLPKALELARGFKRAGFRVIVADPFAWHVTRLSTSVAASICVTAPGEDRQRYLDDILRVIAQHSVDLVVPVSEESMHVAALHPRLPAGVRMYAPAQTTLLALHSKHTFIGSARDFGLAVPDTHLATSVEAHDLASSGPHVIKPIFSCSGRGVKIIRSEQALAAADIAANTIVQRFVPGQVYSSFSIANYGRAVVTSVYKGTVMSGTVSVAFERVMDKPAVERWIDQFIAASNYSGFISFDFVEANDGTTYGIECNPRVTSGVHFIEPDDLARAIVEPEDPRPVRFKKQTLFQQFYPCLTETQKSVFRHEDRANNLKFLLKSRDVIWDTKDPLPFLLMPFTSYQILALSIFKGLSFGEASTRDIEWTTSHQATAH